MADQQQDSKYLLAQVGAELERLAKQHAWLRVCYKGQIVFAPVNLQREGLRVLDVGCADGTLLRDLQKQLSPSAKLVGVDLMASFLPEENLAGNIRYMVQDICEPLPTDLQKAFDLTHVRYLLVGAARVGLGTAIKHLVASLAPGGWLQVQELDLVENSPSYTPALKDLVFIMRSLFDKIGVGANFANHLEALFKEAGLMNVTVQRFELPVGKTLGNETDIRNSIEPFKITIPSLIKGSTAQGVELPESVTDNLQARFEMEMTSEGSRLFNLIVMGQKSA